MQAHKFYLHAIFIKKSASFNQTADYDLKHNINWSSSMIQPLYN